MGELGFWSEKTSQQELGLLSSMGDGGVTLAPSQHLTESVFSVKKQQPLMMRKGGEANGVDKGRNLEEKTPKKKKIDLEKNSELELGEFIPERNVEKGEFLSEGKWRKEGRKWELERGEVVLEKSRKGSLEKGELGSDRWGRCEVEKRGEKKGVKWERDGGDGDKWVGRLDFGSDRGRKFELDRGEFVSENGSYRRKDGNSGENDSRKRAVSSWELKKSSSRSYDEMPGEFRCESGNGKGTVKDHAESWPKRHCVEPEISSRKCHQELSDNSRSKSQRKLEDFPERSYGNTPPILSSRVSSASSNRYPSASRHHEQALQSRVSHEKQTHRDYRDHTPTHSNQSPMERGRHYDKRDHSPSYSNRSPIERARHYEQKDRSPMERSPKERSRHYEERDMSPMERSPIERARHYEQRDRSPMERSPIERARHYEQRDRSPMERSRHDQRELTPIHLDRSPLERVRHHDYRERSPHDRGRGNDYREKSRKSRSGEKQQTSSRHEERPGRRQSGGKDALQLYNNSSSASFGRSGSVDKSKRKDVGDSVKESTELPPPPPPPLPPPPPPPDLPPPPSPPPEQESTVVDEITSMEEDMDICDTPPHDTISADMKPGKWVYLDYFGIEQGPSNLDDLKRLMEEGFLPADHFIKHMESDRWVTVERAASPLVQLNLSSVVSDAVTEMVSPPEASGNSLDGAGDANLDSTFFLLKKNSGGAEELVAVESVDDFYIDERVEALLDGYNVTDGKEIETIEEVLNVTFEHADWESWGHSEGFTKLKSCNLEPTGHSIEEGASKEATEIRPAASLEEYPIIESGCSDWFSSRWSCMGGDWKRSDESANDRSSKKKIALNYGYPLCQMPKSGDEDPRLHRKDDLYRPSHIRRLELPPWAFTLSEDNNDSSTNDMSKSTVPKQMRPPIPRGVKGTILSVVRINSCVVTGQGSSESHVQVRVSERHSHRHTRSNSDRSSSYEGSSHSNRPSEHELQSLHEARSALNIPRDHVCTVDELSLNLGGWYYMDGLGHEIGPFSYSELLILAAKGKILQNSSVFRKLDNSWLPLAFENVHSEKETVASDGLSTNDTKHMGNASRSFHALHPQFIGYMRGKLHELAMKSYKNREFAAAINEVLDPWISAKLAKKEGDKHFPFNSSITKDLSAHKFWRSDDGDDYRYGKRVRLQFDEGDEDVEMEEGLLIDQKNDPSFDELCGGSVFIDEIGTSSEKDNGGWGLLDGHILARVFHFIRSDMRSLISTAATCKHWNMAAKFYKKLCLQVNLSSAGPICTDPMLRSIMGGYEKKRLTSLILAGCSNISPCALEEVLQQFPSISLVDIRGCNQFKDIIPKLQNVSWVKSYLANNRNYDESHSKLKSLKQISDKGSVARFKGLGGYPDETGDFGIDEFNVDRKDSSSQPFRQGFYKRAKLSDAKKSRDAQMRHLLHRKSVNGYKKLEAFIAINLKGIMRENKFDFFIPKVAQIEDRMRNGYYIRRGLGSVKNDISRMCRDAFKSNNRGDTKELKHIIMLFIRLAKSLDGNPGSKNERDDMMRKDGPETGFYSADRYRKKQNKAFEKKGTSRLNSSSYVNGGTDAFDREIKRGLSKLKKRDLGSDSESETSDDHENGFSGGETTASDTESDLDVHSGGGMGDFKGNMYSIVDDSLDSATDDREWGARMTKAGLVPPVTRKYEVIEEYLVIADEEEVKRKMQVALPDDYSEKLLAQKSGMEESEMEIPEVKDYKPRKMPGVEVLEQEVYGIDPYTHNLLLDSMPEEPEWLLVDKHKFIEEVLLRTLNKQVRRFTGARNTPMVYPLRHVVEEIHRNAEEDGDRRIVKLCQTMLKAMQSRRDDNYVAYRKGLGVVCNKEGGFSMDDFVVEFLGEVYPAWKWFEKQDGIRSLQKNSQEPAPEFYNIYLERPKGDRDGYDLVVVDAMHKANYASRICHSCRPNCEAKVTAVDGQYQIGIYTVRPIGYGEEITFDYNSVTESKEEYEASVCLCGSQICRGSYLNLTGEDAFHKVLKEYHGMLDRHKLMLEACEANFVSEEDYIDLGKAGLGKCLLSGLPDWLIAYAVRLVRFINFERTKLPDAILKHNIEEKKKFFADISYEDEKSDAEIQAEGVYNSRLQNLALTLDKVRYVMRRVFGDPKNAPPPLEKLSFEDLVSVLWKGEGSLVEELLQSMAHNMEEDLLNDLKSKILTHDPSNCDNLQRELQKSLLWLRDEVRNLPCSSKSRHDAAADLIHMYAYTKCFYKVRAYEAVTSPPVYISPLDLGPKYVEEMGSGFKEYCKTYGENYCLGQLIYWHSQNNADPDCRLDKVRRGCLSLPDIASFYGKSNKPVQEQVYDSRTVRFMMSRMEKQPQRPWPKDRIWVFKDNQKFFGSPMFDAVLNTCSLDKEMMHWLKSRPTVYQSLWES